MKRVLIYLQENLGGMSPPVPTPVLFSLGHAASDEQKADCFNLPFHRCRNQEALGASALQDFTMNKEVPYSCLEKCPLFLEEKVPSKVSCPPSLKCFLRPLYHSKLQSLLNFRRKCFGHFNLYMQIQTLQPDDSPKMSLFSLISLTHNRLTISPFDETR